MSESGAAARDPRRWWALAALCLAVLIAAIDVTVLNVALPTLAVELRPTGTETVWMADVYSLVLAALLVTMGSLGDRWGRKRMLMWGASAFGVLSVATAFASDARTLILGRAAMGVAGAALMPSTLALIRSTFRDPRERTFAIGIWSTMAAAGEAIGPLVAGVLLEHFRWGSVFLANVPVCVLVVVIGSWSLRESRNPVPGPLDPESVVLSACGLLSLVAGIKLVAANGPGDGWALVAIGAGLVGVTWFVMRQLRLADPMIDMRLFRARTFTGAVLADMLSVFGLAGVLFMLSLDFQFVGGFSPLETGVLLLPAMLGAVVASPTTGQLIRWFGRRRVISGGLLLTAVGLAFLAEGSRGSGWTQAVSLAMVGVGAGWSFTATAEAIMLAAPPERAGAASGVSETAYELGSALGIAVLGTLMTMVYRTSLNLPAGLDPSEVAVSEDSIGGAIEIARNLPPGIGEQVVGAARDAFSNAVFVTSWGAAVVLFGGYVVACLTLPHVDPRPASAAAIRP